LVLLVGSKGALLMARIDRFYSDTDDLEPVIDTKVLTD
jgi:hypothetical protein